MELISENSEAAVSGSVQMNYGPNQISIAASEDVITASETVVNNPEQTVIHKTLVVQKNVLLKEKIVLPKNNSICANHPEEHLDNQTEASSTTIETLTDEMDLASRTSQESKMELASQESVDLKMDICSQESASSKMELGSEENNLTDISLSSDSNVDPLAINVSTEQELLNETVVAKNNDDLFDEEDLKRKKPKCKEDLLDKMLLAREVSLLIRERIVKQREDAVTDREKLIQNLENSVLNKDIHSKSKPRKRIKLSYD